MRPDVDRSWCLASIKLRTRFTGFECNNSLRIILISFNWIIHVYSYIRQLLGHYWPNSEPKHNREHYGSDYSKQDWSELLGRNRNQDNEVNGSPQRQPMPNPGLQRLRRLIGRSTLVTLSSLNCLAEGLPHSGLTGLSISDSDTH